MGDEDHRHLLFGLQPDEELEDLRLDGHVEGGGRLVGDEQLHRTADERHGDHHPLPDAARELVRVLGEALPGELDADLLHDLEGAGTALAARHFGPVRAQHLGELVADPERRVEAGHRLRGTTAIASPQIRRRSSGERRTRSTPSNSRAPPTVRPGGGTSRRSSGRASTCRSPGRPHAGISPRVTERLSRSTTANEPCGRKAHLHPLQLQHRLACAGATLLWRLMGRPCPAAADRRDRAARRRSGSKAEHRDGDHHAGERS
ncbi:MAG: hypothetical protein R3D25_13590 [Geminicoccaceae bacterium]